MATHNLKITIDPVFSGLYAIQRDFQARLHVDVFPSDFDPGEKMAYIREQSLGLTDEIHEALAETGWKSWATSNHINREAYKGELADALRHFMNLMIVAEITPAELMEEVRKKQMKTDKRVVDGYDGVTTKCPRCKRASDDEAVKCHPHDTGDGAWWCDQAGSDVDMNGRQLP